MNYYPIQKLNLNICKPLDLTINSQEMQEVEELGKSQYHQSVNCGTIYMTKEPGSLMNCQEENKDGKIKKALLYLKKKHLSTNYRIDLNKEPKNL